MLLKKIISRYTQYNLWANQILTGWLKTLNRDLLYKQTPSSFNSIDLTLQHMIHAQNFWLTVLAREDFTKLDETLKVNAADIVMNELLAGSQRMLDTFTMYTQEDLSEQVSNDVTTQSRYEFIIHAFNHNTHHRGQIITMSRCLGVENNIPNTDYDTFLLADD